MSYIGNTQQNQSYVPAVDFFSGNGSTTAFTLSKPVATTAQIQAVISNVPQTPGVAYTVSGSTITFTSAPPSGTNNIYVYYTSPNTQVVQPGQGTVYPASLSTGGPYWNISGNVGIGTSSPTQKLTVVDGNVAINKSGTTGTTLINFGDSSDSAAGQILYSHDSDYMRMVTAGSERMRIDSSGNLLVGTTSLSYGSEKVSIYNSSSANQYQACLGLKSAYATGASMVNGVTFMRNDSTVVGYIGWTGSTTTYSTSSDYRLKENIQPMQNALTAVQKLNPVTYKWKESGLNGQGFIAHELQAVVPDCVTGEKDAVDAEGKPVYQGIDTSFLVATLTKAIQELSAKNDALEARIATLEAK